MITEKKLLVWGTGNDASKLMQKYPVINIFVNRFIDSSKTVCSFYDRPVVNPNEVNWGESLFVIVATRKYYDEIEEFLKGRGLISGRDFTDFSMAWSHWMSSFKSDGFAKRIFALHEAIVKAERWIPDIITKAVANEKMIHRYAYESNISLFQAILQTCSDVDLDHNLIELKGGVKFEYNNINELAVIFEELLLNEDYYFETEKKSPLIIDAGANVGLAIYYFKTLYPQSKIVAFEPMPELYNIILRNIERNHWENVEVYPYAVDGSDNDNCIFYVQDSGLAGSLEKRNQEGVSADEIREITVKCIRLSKYINESVDYLKLDVEGSETKVIEEIQDYLDKVQHIFIEFHEGRMKGYNSIAKITGILEEQGFCVNISKSVGSAKGTSYQPMKYVGDRVSEVIWAKRL